jgi:large subunit ribosomal protein L10
VNKEQKAAVIEEVATQIQDSEAVIAVDYRGISVPQAAELRERLNEAGARFRVVKNTLTIRAVEQAGADHLKELLEGPTAFTFVAADGGDVALAAKALSQFRRANQLLEFKGGRMGGEVLTVDQIESIGRLPARDVLDGQLVGVLASPVTGVVRLLNQLIAGVAQQLQQIADQGLVSGEEPAAAAAEEPAAAAADEPAAETPAAESESETEETEKPPAQEAEQEAQHDAADAEAADSAGDESGDEETSSEDASPTEEAQADTPSEGEDEEKEG